MNAFVVFVLFVAISTQLVSGEPTTGSTGASGTYYLPPGSSVNYSNGSNTVVSWDSSGAVTLTGDVSITGNLHIDGTITNIGRYLISKVVTTGSATSVTFSSIPQTYNHLELIVRCSSTGSSGHGYIQMNGISSGYTSVSKWFTSSGTSQGSNPSDGFDMIYTLSSFAKLSFFAYTDTTYDKTSIGYGSNGGEMDMTFTTASSTSAITLLVVYPGNGGNFIDGSLFYLYGLM